MPDEPSAESRPDRAWQSPAEAEARPRAAGSATESVQHVSSTAERERRRRYLAEIFGEVLPSTTSDDTDHAPSWRDTGDWYRENRPPHHE